LPGYPSKGLSPVILSGLYPFGDFGEGFTVFVGTSAFFFVDISQGKHDNSLHMYGYPERFPENIRIKIAYPAGSQSNFGSGEAYMFGCDSCIYVSEVFTVCVFSFP
jgi:hypothetical protein